MSIYQFSTSLVPETLCINNPDHRLATLVFFGNIQTKLCDEKLKIHIDLSEVKMATAAASLLFFAIISEAKLRLNDPKAVRFTWPQKAKNIDGHKVIVATGLSSALLANSISELDKLTIEERYFQSSVDPETQLVSSRQFLIKNMDNPLNENQFALLTAAIGEAMINVRHHAYELEGWQGKKVYLGGSRWWQCSWYDQKQDALYFIICDLGCGVVESYKSSHLEKVMTEFDMLNEAFCEGFSRFIDQGRGNGSEDIKRPIIEEKSMHDVKFEQLLVLSGYSQYEYSIQNNKPRVLSHEVTSSIPGTLSKATSFLPGTIVEWCLIPERR
ncbi:hypothetical protein [Providencia sp.]|uniref:hypothetical protein n=1 Tax=Providencia sp. TaxID=589 RepID=UPI003F9C7018